MRQSTSSAGAAVVALSRMGDKSVRAGPDADDAVLLLLALVLLLLLLLLLGSTYGALYCAGAC
jgi:hypothetical protein